MAQQFIDNTAPDADNLFSGATKINSNFTEVYGDIASIETSVTGVQDDITAVEGDVATLQSNITNPVQPDYITGLSLDWVANNQFRVNTGGCYTPGAGNLGTITSASTITTTGLSASTFYYVYAIVSGSTLTFEYNSTVPVGYYANAKQKTGDNTRRYLGSFLTDGSSNIRRFRKDGALS